MAALTNKLSSAKHLLKELRRSTATAVSDAKNSIALHEAVAERARKDLEVAELMLRFCDLKATAPKGPVDLIDPIGERELPVKGRRHNKNPG